MPFLGPIQFGKSGLGHRLCVRPAVSELRRVEGGGTAHFATDYERAEEGPAARADGGALHGHAVANAAEHFAAHASGRAATHWGRRRVSEWLARDGPGIKQKTFPPSLNVSGWGSSFTLAIKFIAKVLRHCFMKDIIYR